MGKSDDGVTARLKKIESLLSENALAVRSIERRLARIEEQARRNGETITRLKLMLDNARAKKATGIRQGKRK